MFHAKFHDHRSISSVGKRLLKVFAIYWHGDHLVHVTWAIYIYFVSTFPRKRHIKYGFDCQAVLEKKIFENGGHIHVYSSGAGAETPWGQFLSQSVESFAACFPNK